jgi:hypothetical protein
LITVFFFVNSFSFPRLLITSPIRLATEEDETNSSFFYNETQSCQTSNSTIIANLPPPSSYYHHPSPHTSYFNSAIETAIKQHLNDDEPIPFIDDNLSVTHSRKSSACWSDRTSLSSRFGLAWRLNLMRSNTQIRPPTPSNDIGGGGGGGVKRFNYRTIRYAIPSSQQFRTHDEM